jgi:diguanylate cyclase (GGDEF)-like protein/PAS domain S-box-containing protein
VTPPADDPTVDPIHRLFSLSADMLGTASADGYFTQLNPAWERSLGWTSEELMVEPYLSFVHPDDVQRTAAEAARLSGAASDVLRAFENRYRTRDGSYRSIEWTVVAEDGVMFFVAKDVTEPKAADAAQREAAALTRRSEALHRTLTANLPDTSVFLIGHDLRVLVADGEAIRRLAWSGEEMFRGQLVTELSGVPDDVLQLSLDSYRAALRGERRTFEFDSGNLTFSVQAVPVRAHDGSVEAALVVARDITERTRAAEQLARHARQQEAIVGLGRFALQSHELGELLIEAVTVAQATLGVDVASVLELDDGGETLTRVAAAGVPDSPDIPLRITLSESGNAEYTLHSSEPVIIDDLASETRFTPSRVLLGLGVVSSVGISIEDHVRPFGILNVHVCERRVFSDDEVGFLGSVATLITVAVTRDRTERATLHAALHDPLTSLPNRTLALDRLAHALARRRREGINVAVLALDLDRFKLINDSVGHAAGDTVLLALAPRLAAAVRATDTVARIGGDEFVVICPSIEGAHEATNIAERLAAEINRPLLVESGEYFFTVSTGITLAAGPEDTPGSLLRDADAAMYRAKERGRGRHELFDEAMRTQATMRLRIEAELRRARDRGELEVWYQPVIDLATNRPVATEALIRWRHPERGLVGPLDFIPIAEETGLIVEIGLHVLEEACRQTAIWQRDDPAFGVSVNVSGHQVANPLFPAQAASIAERSGLRPGTLALEITESVLMAEADAPETVLGTLQRYGLTLALDDFGTGYSSLSRLKHFPLDQLKIDRSFVAGVEDDPDDRAIVKATIDMAHALGLIVVAEGVETREQEDYLRALGCNRVQGYLYARPEPAAAITELLLTDDPTATR